MTGGDSFSAWYGYIKGENLILEPYHIIVQFWRSNTFQENEEDSQIEVTLLKKEGTTEITLIHSNVPEDGEHYIQGWQVHYFDPIKSYFEY